LFAITPSTNSLPAWTAFKSFGPFSRRNVRSAPASSGYSTFDGDVPRSHGREGAVAVDSAYVTPM